MPTAETKLALPIPPTAAQCAVILVIDRWGAGFLAPYGNTWLETQALNQFASEAVLVETCFGHSPDLATTYGAYWQGWQSFQQPEFRSPKLPVESLLAAAKRKGLQTILLTDEPLLRQFPLAAQFEQQIYLPLSSVTQAAGEVAETALGKLLAEALNLLSQQTAPYFLWIHSQGMAGPWDAPPEFRNQFAEEEDPLPGDFVEPPLETVPTDVDPDELLAVSHAYAGQVSVIDLCVGALADALEAHPLGGQTLFALTSPRGYPVGEHGQIGPLQPDLFSELLQVPLLLRFPQKFSRLTRLLEILQPADLATTLSEALQLDWAGEKFSPPGGGILSRLGASASPPRQIAVAWNRAGQRQRAIRTPAWLLRETIVPVPDSAESQTTLELFVKPDDRWEVNEIASRGGDSPGQLLTELDKFEQAAQTGQLSQLTPLEAQLASEWH